MDWCETLHTSETDVENNSLPRKKKHVYLFASFFFFPNSDSLSASLIVPEHEGGTVLPRYFFSCANVFPWMQSESVHTHIYLILATVQKRQKGMFPSVSFSVCPVMFRWEVTVCVSFKWEKKKKIAATLVLQKCTKAILYNPQPWCVVKPNGILKVEDANTKKAISSRLSV